MTLNDSRGLRGSLLEKETVRINVEREKWSTRRFHREYSSLSDIARPLLRQTTFPREDNSFPITSGALLDQNHRSLTSPLESREIFDDYKNCNPRAAGARPRDLSVFRGGEIFFWTLRR